MKPSLKKEKLKIAFCGTPDFSVPTLETLYYHPLVDLVHIISMPSRPAHRNQELHDPMVIKFAKEKKIPFTQTENINEEETLLTELKNIKLDAFIVLAFAQFLKKHVLNLPLLGSFNIHTSLLPRHRGAAPIHYALLKGDSETGVSIQKMVSKMDAGNILLSQPIKIPTYETQGSLYCKLKYLSAVVTSDFIEKLHQQQLTETIQDESQITFAPEIPKEMGKIIFSDMTSKEIDCLVRALNPMPSTFCFFQNKRIKLHEVKLVDFNDHTLMGLNQSRQNENLKPGSVLFCQQRLFIKTKDDLIEVTSLQLEGKGKISGSEFIRGQNNQLVLEFN